LSASASPSASAGVDHGGWDKEKRRKFLESQNEEVKYREQLNQKETIIINTSLMGGLKDHYGKIKGEDTYLDMKKENSAPFRKGINTAREHGHLEEYTPKYVGWKKRK